MPAQGDILAQLINNIHATPAPPGSAMFSAPTPPEGLMMQMAGSAMPSAPAWNQMTPLVNGAAPASRFAELGAELGPSAPTWGSRVFGVGEGLAGTALTKGTLMKGGAYAGAGLLGGSLANKLDIGGKGSKWDQGITGAVTGAGIGAGIGSVFGPADLITVPVGAALGGLAGGLIGVFGPKHDNAKQGAQALAKEQPRLLQFMQTAGIAPEMQNQLWKQYQFGLASLVDDKGHITKNDVKQLDAAMLSAIQNQMVSDIGDAQANLKRTKSMQEGLALLAYATAMHPGINGAKAAGSLSGIQDVLAGTYGKQQSALTGATTRQSDLTTLLGS